MAFMAAKALEILKKAGEIVQTLSIYGASGIVAFGWAFSRLLHFTCKTYVPLWFCAAIFIYNLDRLKTDPADPINIPRRSREAVKWRKFSFFAAAASALSLVALPLWEGDYLMAALAIGGGVFCANYSLAPLGFRFKDVPFVKTLFAPTIVTAALLAPPLLEQGAGNAAVHYLTATAWTWCVLMFNMLLCDMRDINGDSLTGTRSLPVALGAGRTVRLLWGLLGVIAVLSAAAVRQAAPGNIALWKVLGGGTILYLAALLVAARRMKTPPESFYEWWVEGILFVPALLYPFAR